jgi:uncharacterized repeat protein (TIGR01451 family)
VHNGPVWFISSRFCKSILALIACFSPFLVNAQIVNQYTNTISGAVNDLDCGTANQVTRNFTVGESSIVGDVNIGVLATHTYRSDLRLSLRSPVGTVVPVMVLAGNTQSGDNLNDLFDDEAAASIGAHVATAIDATTPLPPPYLHSFQPSNPLSAFKGQNANGTWTMILCDAVNADTGTFLRADLYITSTSLSVSKTSTIVSDPINGTNGPKAVPGAQIRYCVLVTNNGGAVQTNIAAVDPLPSSVTFVAGSMRSGASCSAATAVEDNDVAGADDSDPFGMSFSSAIVSGTAATLAVGARFAMVFDVTIN